MDFNTFVLFSIFTVEPEINLFGNAVPMMNGFHGNNNHNSFGNSNFTNNGFHGNSQTLNGFPGNNQTINGFHGNNPNITGFQSNGHNTFGFPSNGHTNLLSISPKNSFLGNQDGSCVEMNGLSISSKVNGVTSFISKTRDYMVYSTLGSPGVTLASPLGGVNGFSSGGDHQGSSDMESSSVVEHENTIEYCGGYDSILHDSILPSYHGS